MHCSFTLFLERGGGGKGLICVTVSSFDGVCVGIYVCFVSFVCTCVCVCHVDSSGTFIRRICTEQCSACIKIRVPSLPNQYTVAVV